MAKKELPDFLGKHCKEINAVLATALNKLRMSKKNEKMYQDFLRYQCCKIINSETSRGVTGDEVNIDLQVMGYFWEAGTYVPTYLLRLCVIKFSGTIIDSSTISPAENEYCC